MEPLTQWQEVQIEKMEKQVLYQYIRYRHQDDKKTYPKFPFDFLQISMERTIQQTKLQDTRSTFVIL